jgi:hypothetical protein
MSEKSNQAMPAGAPPAADAESGALEAALAAPEEHRIGLRLNIAGGLAGERYDFDFTIEGTDGGQCGMRCELSGRHADRRSVEVDPAELAGMMRSFAPQMMMAADAGRAGGFPPCSLIGRLELTVDGERRVHFFMADEGQAETVGYELPAHIKNAVDRLYELAEKRLGMDNVRP